MAVEHLTIIVLVLLLCCCSIANTPPRRGGMEQDDETLEDAHWLFDWSAPLLPEAKQVVLSTEESPGTWVYIYRAPTALAESETPLDGQPAPRR
jgi:hypothetical protein